jgi:RNA polymerase sigma-70 factor (ECF subfamily)
VIGIRAVQMTENSDRAAIQADPRVWERDLPGLMLRYQQGDAVAVEELVRSISPFLLRFFATWDDSRGEAEDLLQDCWMRIHRSRHTYRSSEPLLPWIFAVARHTRLDGYRRRRRRQSKEIPISDVPEMSASPGRAAAIEISDLRRMLEGLPENQREVILMLKVSGMSLEEVARATSSTVGAIKQRAHRAYRELRARFEKGRHS